MLEHLTEPDDLVECDERGGEGGEGEMDVGTPLVAEGEAPEATEPSQGALGDLAVSAEFLAAVDPPPGDARGDVALAALAAAEGMIIGFVGVQLVGAPPRPTPAALDRRHGVERRGEHFAVVAVGRAQHEAERRALAVDHDMALGARLAAVDRARPGGVAPLFAGTAALSSAARRQSILSASRSRASRIACRCFHTPAVCQSRNRRQQVMPQPQPISRGSISQGMPLFRTKMIPASAARLSTGGRPPFGRGRGAGNSGATIDQSSSRTRSVAILRPTPINPFC